MKSLRKSIVIFMILAGVSSLFAGGNKEAAVSSGEETLKPATYTWTAGSMGGGWYNTGWRNGCIIKRKCT